MAPSFLIDDILRKESEESATGSMLQDYFYFLKLLKVATGDLVPIKSSDISATFKCFKKAKCWLENQTSSSSPLHLLWTIPQIKKLLYMWIYQGIYNLNLDFVSILDKELTVLVDSEDVSKCRKNTERLQIISIIVTLETN